MERITGAIVAVDQSAHTVTVKDDKTGDAYTVDLASTRLLLKVEPTAKDLKGATRITANDLETGDRVQVGVTAKESGSVVPARSVLLMSARELQQVHQAQAAAWQQSVPGVVTSVDAAGQKLGITARTPEGTKPVMVDVSKTEFTRYSPDTPKTPAASTLAQVQTGDQVRIIGRMDASGSSLAAQRIYSSSARTLLGTVTSVSADGKQIEAKDLQSKQTVTITLNDESAVRKLPPMMAYALARRFNPDFKAPAANGPGASAGQDASSSGGVPSVSSPEAAKAGEGSPTVDAQAAGRAGGSGAGIRPGVRSGDVAGDAAGDGSGRSRRGPALANGDLSQMLDRLPKISAADLKPGDAVVIAGTPAGGNPPGTDKNHLTATTVIAGVEPIFQAASPRQAQSLGDWGASLGGGGADAGTPQQ